jgi:hypothetical protein
MSPIPCQLVSDVVGCAEKALGRDEKKHRIAFLLDRRRHRGLLMFGCPRQMTFMRHHKALLSLSNHFKRHQPMVIQVILVLS